MRYLIPLLLLACAETAESDVDLGYPIRDADDYPLVATLCLDSASPQEVYAVAWPAFEAGEAAWIADLPEHFMHREMMAALEQDPGLAVHRPMALTFAGYDMVTEAGADLEEVIFPVE
jgi:hypothetical protein